MKHIRTVTKAQVEDPTQRSTLLAILLTVVFSVLLTGKGQEPL
jgi:hypothetical protein